MLERTRIELQEYRPVRLGHDALREDQGLRIYSAYHDQVEVEFPSPKTDRQWELKSKGWVGFIPLDDEIALELKPKVSIENLFRMLEYAYDLKGFRFLPDMADCDSLREFYERLAKILAKLVLDRERKGLHRDYVSRQEQLPYLRGRWDMGVALRRFWDPTVACNYQEHTADIDENTILTWTLFTIAQGGLCTERVLPEIRRAYRALRPLTALTSKTPQDCSGRRYTRLNSDYEPMHALCRFFLEQTGPTHHRGDRTTLPFLVNMNTLFEKFVARWLSENLPEGLQLYEQETITIDELGHVEFRIDLDIRDKKSGVSLFILDTKYKAPEYADTADVQQIIAYCAVKHCMEGILVYPTPLKYPIDRHAGGIRVRSVVFDIGVDLEVAGRAVLNSLGIVGQQENHYPV